MSEEKKSGQRKAVITDYAFDNIDLEREALAPLGCRLEALKAGKDQALIDLVRDADAVITQFAPVTAEVIGIPGAASGKNCTV